MSASTIFQNEEIYQKIFLESLESIPQATEAIKKSYSEMGSVFEEHIGAIEEWMFRHAYECGYRAAMDEIKKGE